MSYEDPRWGGDETLALTTDPGCKMSRPAQEELDREFGSTSALACSLGSTNLSNKMGVEQSLRTHQGSTNQATRCSGHPCRRDHCDLDSLLHTGTYNN